MTISPLMVELFPPIDTMDLQQQQTDLQDIFTERTSGAPFPGPWVRVESIISQRGETWKSKALLIYHFKYILFVSSWKFSLFLEFYWLLPSICLLHDAAFCRRVGWWSCVMVTVLLKKEIGNMSHSQAFSWTHMTKMLGFILKKEKKKKKKENTHLREEGRAPGFSVRESAGAASSLWVTVLRCLTLKTHHCECTVCLLHLTSENEVIHGIKCGDYAMGAHLTFDQIHTHNWRREHKGGGQGYTWGTTAPELSASLWAH